jgi:SAM-dependent methyltransferase
MTDHVLNNKEKFFDLWAPNYDFLLTTVFYQAVHKRLLEYVELQVFSEVSRVLRPDGRFYLVDYTVKEETGMSYFPFSPGGIRFYSPPRREQLGATAGLKCLGHHYLLGAVLLTIFQRLNE